MTRSPVSAASRSGRLTSPGRSNGVMWPVSKHDQPRRLGQCRGDSPSMRRRGETVVGADHHGRRDGQLRGRRRADPSRTSRSRSRLARRAGSRPASARRTPPGRGSRSAERDVADSRVLSGDENRGSGARFRARARPARGSASRGASREQQLLGTRSPTPVLTIAAARARARRRDARPRRRSTSHRASVRP